MDCIEKYFIKNLGSSNNLYQQFLASSSELKLYKNQYLVEKGFICDVLGIVQSGVLRSYLLKDGEEYTSDFYFPETVVVSYRSFLTREKSPGYIQAVENSCIRIITKSDFDNLLESSCLGYKWGKIVSDTLFINKCRKETSLLVDSAFERYKLLLTTYPKIEQLVSQRLIASYLGIKPESLSRIKRLNLG